jgi:hypothetical protein
MHACRVIIDKLSVSQFYGMPPYISHSRFFQIVKAAHRGAFGIGSVVCDYISELKNCTGSLSWG